MTPQFSLHPIGYVRSRFKTVDDLPLQGGPAVLEIEPRYAEALDGLHNSTHVLVMGFMHLANRASLRARPVKVDPEAPARGVFSTRSPSRPNPVSITVVPVLARDGLRLEVDRLDLVDGTPIIDIKSYCPGWDSVFCAQHRHRAAPSAIDVPRLAACLTRDLENFMGATAHQPAARWGLAATLVAARHLEVDSRDPSVSVSVNRSDTTTEALMALTGAAFSNGRLTTAPDDGPLRATFDHAGRRVVLVARTTPPAADPMLWSEAFDLTETLRDEVQS